MKKINFSNDDQLDSLRWNGGTDLFDYLYEYNDYWDEYYYNIDNYGFGWHPSTEDRWDEIFRSKYPYSSLDFYYSGELQRKIDKNFNMNDFCNWDSYSYQNIDDKANRIQPQLGCAICPPNRGENSNHSYRKYYERRLNKKKIDKQRNRAREAKYPWMKKVEKEHSLPRAKKNKWFRAEDRYSNYRKIWDPEFIKDIFEYAESLLERSTKESSNSSENS